MLQSAGSASAGNSGLGEGKGEDMLLRVDERLDGLDRPANDVSNVEWLSLQLDLPAADPGDVEQVVNQTSQLAGLAVDDIMAPLQVGAFESLHAEQFDGAGDRSKGVSQLVRKHGQEFVLTSVGFFQGLLDSFALRDVVEDDPDVTTCRPSHAECIDLKPAAQRDGLVFQRVGSPLRAILP